MGVTRHIIGSFGDIGAEIIKETAKVPADIAGKTLESLGAKSGKTKGQQQDANRVAESALGKVINATDKGAAPARRVLEEYIGYGRPPKKEPSIWEKKQTEDAQEKKMLEKQKEEKRKKTLPKMSTRPKPGMYGIHEKITEASKNVRAE